MQAAASSTDLASIQTRIVDKQFDEALADLDSILEEDSENVDALYMHAVCCRYLRRFDEALETLDRLKALAPDYSRAHQEEGHAHRDAGRPNEALRAYARACALNPALEASWRGQLDILRNKGSDHRAVWAPGAAGTPAVDSKTVNRRHGPDRTRAPAQGRRHLPAVPAEGAASRRRHAPARRHRQTPWCSRRCGVPAKECNEDCAGRYPGADRTTSMSFGNARNSRPHSSRPGC